ncbi:protein NODULATION SIGNALING PATHWAY 2 [Cryptomeria japonica]|uniref:protein NODULATION SIGNALING PATHWAY 2 n=1 Tax=Cryptomeria japonica TaxID=3369 RepID=UPI0027DA8BAF|nr:protein NODULATION SIGNALING PATHWAY 2 [Cryptomeria japonica]
MGDTVREQQRNVFDEQVFQNNYYDSVDIADFIDVASLESDFWSDLIQDKGNQDCWPTPKIHSIEDEISEIIYSTHKSEESITQLEHGMDTVHSCSPDEEAVNYDYSSGSTNFSFDCDAFFQHTSTDSEEFKGLRLVHFLTACAEAISHGKHDLVEILFFRLTELVSPIGTSMERVAFHLSHSLRHAHLRLLGANADDMFKGCNNVIQDPNYVGAFTLLNLVYPYIRFAHFTANQSILEAVNLYLEMEEDPDTHLNARAVSGPWVLWIIDFDIREGLQWPPLMEALKSEATKLRGLRLTAIKWHDDDDEQFSCNNTGRRLSEYASSLGIPFSFEEMEVGNLKGNLRQKEDEVIAVNCMWELPHMGKRSKQLLADLINGVRHLKPVILTVGSGPAGMDNHENLNFTERFNECLRNLCAVFDSSQVGLAEKFGLARANVENLFLGPMVCRSMNYLRDNIQEWDLIPVMDLALKSGFVERDISDGNILYAKYILAGSEGGRCYTVELMGKHQLLLKWNSTSLVCVSSFRAL